MEIDWNQPDIQDWKENAKIAQQTNYIMLGDRFWDQYEYDERNLLAPKVAYALYGPPGKDENSNMIDIKGYSIEQRKKVNELVNIIVDLADAKAIQLSVIFIVVKIVQNHFTIPVFEVNSNGTEAFVDMDARIYKHWRDYLDNNRLPKCIYCYPINGYYSCSPSDYEYDPKKNVGIEFGTSPACNYSSHLGRVFDTTTTITGLVSAGVGIVSLFTPLAPIVVVIAGVTGIGSGIYGAGRSIDKLIDRGSHGQSIAPNNIEAFGCWLNIVGTTLGTSGVVGSTLAANAGRTGSVMSQGSRFVVNALNIGSVSVNGAGILYGLGVLIDKSENDQLTTLDVLQFSASVFFFTHSAINVKTASSIIKQAQNDVIDQYRNNLSDESLKHAFDKMATDTRGTRQMHGNAKVIKAIKHINNSNEFFKSLGMVQNEAASTESKVVLVQDGETTLISINDNVELYPLKFEQMSAEDRQTILSATKDFSNEAITNAEYLNRVKTVCRVERIGFKVQRQEFLQKAAKTFGVEDLKTVKIGGKQIFNNLSGVDIDRMQGVMENAGRNFDQKIVKIAENFAAAHDCSSPQEFCSFVEYISNFISENGKSKSAEETVMKELQNAESQHYKMLDSEFVNNLKEIYQCNKEAQIKFGCNKSATYHFVKHREFESVEVTPQDYFEIAGELFGNDANWTTVKLSQDGGCVRIIYTDKSKAVSSVLIEPRYTVDTVHMIATMYYQGNVK